MRLSNKNEIELDATVCAGISHPKVLTALALIALTGPSFAQPGARDHDMRQSRDHGMLQSRQEMQSGGFFFK